MKYTQANYTLQHLQNTRPEWLPGNTEIDWQSYDRWNARMKSATRRAANMKHLWDMHMTEEYIQRKFSKGDGMCRCGKALETSTHVLHECSCEANSLGREQMTHKIHSSIRTLVATRAITPDWSWFLTRMFTLDESGKTEMWAPGTTPSWSLMAQGQRIPTETKKNIMSWVRMGSECLWKGLFPAHITATLCAMGMSSKTAEKWSGNLRELLLDGATSIWRLRCRECNDGKLPDSEATTRLRECALELWRNMEEETPAHERKQREVTENQISEVSPHRLRALVRSLEHEMQTRNKPTIALLLIRRAPEQNLLVTPADTDEEKSLRRMQAAAISNVELLTTSLPCGIPNITYMHMQLTHDYDRTEVEIHQTYRHAFDIHRCMGRQRVHVRPLFVGREREKVRDGIVTTSRRQLTIDNKKSTKKNRLYGSPSTRI